MTAKPGWGDRSFEVHNGPGEAPRYIIVKGRARWALEALIDAGDRGCTPIDTPGPRWSHYVWLLRGDGIEIETIHEKHGGPFSGTHARYVLRSDVRPAEPARAAA